MGADQIVTEQVYVIGSPSSALVKIGRSTNLERRLADLQRMSPVPLKVLCTYDGGSELEAALHRYFKDRRTHGEWFDLDSDPVASTKAAIDHMKRLAEEKRRRAAERAHAKAHPQPKPKAMPEAADEEVNLESPLGRMAIIYRLRDPRDGTIRYVGSASTQLSRLRRRLASVVPPAVRPWLRELRETRERPKIEVVEIVPSGHLTRNNAKSKVIEAHLADGHPLLDPPTNESCLTDEALIRPARAGDLGAIVTLWEQVADWLRSRGMDSQKPHIERTAKAIAAGECFLVEDEGIPVATVTVDGHAECEFWTKDELQEPALYVHRMAVRRDVAGPELGSTMLDWASLRAKGRGAKWLRLEAWRDHPDLCDHYASRGFTHLRTIEIPSPFSGALFQRAAGQVRNVGPALTAREASGDGPGGVASKDE